MSDHKSHRRSVVSYFYLRGADRRSRHSDSLALGKQAGRCRGRRTHAQGPRHTNTSRHAHTHTMPWEEGKEKTHSRGWECSKEGKMQHFLVKALIAWKHTETHAYISRSIVLMAFCSCLWYFASLFNTFVSQNIKVNERVRMKPL